MTELNLVEDVADALESALANLSVGGADPRLQRDARPEEIREIAEDLAEIVTDPALGWTWSKIDAATEGPLREYVEAEHSSVFPTDQSLTVFVQALVAKGWTVQ